MRAVLLVVLVGCGSGDIDSATLGPCEGGGTPGLEMGSNGSDFTAWTDGQTVALVEPGGELSLTTTARVSGLDAGEQVNAVLRVIWDGTDTDDYIGGFFLQCDEATGQSPLTVTAAVPEPWQTDPTGLFGTDIPLTLTVTDAAGRSATQSLTIRPASP